MRIRKLLMSVIVLCFCSFATVQAEGEQEQFAPVVDYSMENISDVSINFTKGNNKIAVKVLYPV